MKTPLLERIATDYRKSCILFGATQLGMFRHLIVEDQPLSFEKLAEKLEVETPRLRALVNCLVQYGVLQTHGNKVALDDDLKKTIGEEEFGALENYRSEVNEWLELASILKNKPTRSREDELFSSESIFPYLDMVKSSNRERITKTAPIICNYAREFKSMIDIGGGHGAFSVEILRIKPDVHATIYDLPVAIDYAKQGLSVEFSKSLTFLTGDARDMEIEGQYDVALVNDLLHSFGAEDKRIILRKAVQAIAPGGKLFVGKFFMDEDDPKNPANNHIFSMKMVLNTRNGYLESIQEVKRDLAELNCIDIHVFEIEHHMPSVIIAAIRSEN